MTALRLLLSLIVLLLGAPVAAQLGAAAGPNHIAAELVAETAAPAPGQTTTLAIAMTPSPTWHGYWLNGGDAGFGMQVEWRLPPGVTVGELAYPVPETLVIAGLMNHVYERPYALLAPLQVAADVPRGTRLPIVGEANWLACTDRVCVPERGTLRMELVAGDGNVEAPTAARFDAWRADLPQPLGSPARFARVGETLRIALPYPAGAPLSAPHIFIAEQGPTAPGATQRFFRAGDLLIAELAVGDRPAQALSGVLRIGEHRGLSFSATPGAVPSGGNPIATDSASDRAASGATFGWALLGALIGGLLLNIMPCVFPILSLKALALARAGGDEAEVRAEGVAYTLGAVFTALALGAALLLLRAGGEAIGWAFQLQNPAMILLLIVLTAAIAANLAGLFELRNIGIGDRWAQAGGAKGAFATGALAAFVATPCSGPFLGAALGATLVLPSYAALAVFGGLGLGLALPFLLLAFVPALRRRLPKPGSWMERLRRWLALPMALTLAALVWLLWRQAGVTGLLVALAASAVVLALGWWAGRRQRAGLDPRPAIFLLAASAVPLALLLPAAEATPRAVAPTLGQPWDAARVEAARAAGRPVFVYFTADWCVSCKVNEAAAIDRAETRAAFERAGVAVFVADWTRPDPAITRELARHGRNSVPLYLWYAPSAQAPELLPQLLTPAMLTDRAAAVPRAGG